MILRAHPLVFLPVLGLAMLMLPGCWKAGSPPGEPMILMPMADAPWNYGFINERGKFAIKPQWNRVKRFSEGFAFVQDKRSEQWAVIDRSGKVVQSPRY